MSENEKNTCRCVTLERCPQRTDVDKAQQADGAAADGSFENMNRLFCQFSHVLIGTIERVSNESVPVAGYSPQLVMDIKVSQKYEGTHIISGDIKPTGKEKEREKV